MHIYFAVLTDLQMLRLHAACKQHVQKYATSTPTYDNKSFQENPENQSSFVQSTLILNTRERGCQNDLARRQHRARLLNQKCSSQTSLTWGLIALLNVLQL